MGRWAIGTTYHKIHNPIEVIPLSLDNLLCVISEGLRKPSYILHYKFKSYTMVLSAVSDVGWFQMEISLTVESVADHQHEESAVSEWILE